LVTPLLPVDAAALSTFYVVNVLDPRELLDPGSRRPPNDSQVRRYQLQDCGLRGVNFDSPITSIAGRRLGSMMIGYGADRFGTMVKIGADGFAAYCFTALSYGRASLIQHGEETPSSGASGLAYRAAPGTRLLTSDVNARRTLWIEASALEDALEGMLGNRLRERLAFKPGIDWTSGLAASLRGQIDFLMGEIKRRGGVADNPVALASLADLMVSLVLRGIPHNYLDRLGSGHFGAVPAYVRRADDFMRANAAVPIRMNEVAAAAGCSVRTLNAVFRQFRDTTPLAALHTIRLEQVRTELAHNVTGASISEVSRRFGFTNPGRLAAAYRRRFGESPAETVRHGSG
jgi:AraC-like DNA-binding protein